MWISFFKRKEIEQTLQIANCLVSLYDPTYVGMYTYLFRYTSKVEKEKKIFFILRGIDLPTFASDIEFVVLGGLAIVI